MKALSVQQPFAYEILSGLKTIEVRSWDTLHRGDLLICSSKKAAYPAEEMEDMEEDYGCTFLYGHALCVVTVADVRPMRKGDEDEALVEEIDPEAYSWVLEDVRPAVPFPVKGKLNLFDVDDGLIALSPFAYDGPVVVRQGTVDQDFGIDFSGWRGRARDIVITEPGEPRIVVAWDSLTLKSMPISVIEGCMKGGFTWIEALLRLQEIERAEPRDTWDDVEDAVELIVEENPDLFEE